MKKSIQRLFGEDIRFVSLLKKSESYELCVFKNIKTDAKIVAGIFEKNADVSVYVALMGHFHKNICNVYDVVELEDCFIVLFEYIDGITLNEYMKSKKFSEREIRNIAGQILNGLYALHSLDIIHKDIKPGNVMIDKNNNVKIIDYDISKLITLSKTSHSSPDKTVALGTTGFAAPEQYGINPTDERTDIFAFGILLNLMFTGKHPAQELYNQKHYGKIIKKCICVNPNDRYKNILALKKDF